MTVWAAVDRRLFAEGEASRLAIVRAGLAGLLGLRVALGPFAGLGGQPAALFDPPALLGWLPQMPSRSAILAVQMVGVAAAVAAVARWKPRVTFAVAWACLLLLAGLKDSLGKILHNDVLLLLAAVPLLGAPADSRPGEPTRSARFGWPVEATVVVVAVAYFTSGARKLASSGLDWITGDTMRWIMYQAAAGDRAPTDAVARAVADRPWLATTVAAGIVALELSAPLVLVSRRFRPWFAAAAVAFHTGTWLTLGLDYWAWAVVVLLVLPGWGRLSGRRRQPSAPERRRAAADRATEASDAAAASATTASAIRPAPVRSTQSDS